MDVGVCAEPRYMTVSTREFASLLHLPLYLPHYVSALTLLLRAFTFLVSLIRIGYRLQVFWGKYRVA